MKYRKITVPLMLALASLFVFSLFPDKRRTLSSIAIKESPGMVFAIVTIDRQTKGNAFDLLTLSRSVRIRHDQFIIESDGVNSSMISGRKSPSENSNETMRRGDDYYQFQQNDSGDVEVYQILDNQFLQTRVQSAEELSDQKKREGVAGQPVNAENKAENKILYTYSCRDAVANYIGSQLTSEANAEPPFQFYHYIISFFVPEDFSSIDFTLDSPIKIGIQRDRSLFGETCNLRVLDKTYKIINYQSWRMILSFALLLLSPFSAIYYCFKSKREAPDHGIQ